MRSPLRILLATGILLALGAFSTGALKSAPGASSSVASARTDSKKSLRAARAALRGALARGNKNGSVEKAFRAYELAVNERIKEMIDRMKELNARIHIDPIKGTVDTPEELAAARERLNRSGVKDELLSLQKELAGLYDELEEFSQAASGFEILANGIIGPGCPPGTITNTLGGTSPDFPSATGSQTGRLLLNGVVSACNLVKGCPGSADSAVRVFDQYQFVNTGCVSACVSVTLTMTSDMCGSNLGVAAYLTGYNPASLCTNYLADPGQSAAFNVPATFAFNVPAQTGFVVVVYEVTAGAGTACPYTLGVSGLCQPCQITCPANITVSNDPNQCGAVVNYPAPATCGNCGTITCSPASGSFYPVGTTTVTCTTTAMPSCTFTITVADTQPPSITCPSNVTATTATTCPPSTSAVVNFPPPTASDNCPGVVTVCNPASGSTFPVGTTTVTCTATDASGNTATCSFSVSVFNGCLQDDSNPTSVVLFNTFTGQYQFCCGGAVFTGTASVLARGCTFSLQHNPPDRRVLITVDFATKRGTASIQSPPGTIKCTIGDRDISNNTCLCVVAPALNK